MFYKNNLCIYKRKKVLLSIRIISQNINNYGIEVSKDTIFRINLACNFKNYIQKLVDFCDSNKIMLLRTIGVIFSDEEKRISEYIK